MLSSPQSFSSSRFGVGLRNYIVNKISGMLMLLVVWGTLHSVQTAEPGAHLSIGSSAFLHLLKSQGQHKEGLQAF